MNKARMRAALNKAHAYLEDKIKNTTEYDTAENVVKSFRKYHREASSIYDKIAMLSLLTTIPYTLDGFLLEPPVEVELELRYLPTMRKYKKKRRMTFLLTHIREDQFAWYVEECEDFNSVPVTRYMLLEGRR